MPGQADHLAADWRDEPMTRVLEFARAFGATHATLAMHAAVPLSLTPELVHVIRLNMVRSVPRIAEADLRIAEADLLLSDICRDVGGGYYQMDAEVRDLLIEELRSDPLFGEPRLLKVAELLLAYVGRSLRGTRDAELRSFLLVQEWTALAYLQPALAAKSIAAALKDGLTANRGADALRVASLAQALAGPLHAEEEVLLYAAGVEKLVSGQISLGVRFLEALGPSDQRHEVHGIPLPSADEWRRSFETPPPSRGRPSETMAPAAQQTETGAWEFYVLEEDNIVKEGAFRGVLEIGRQQGFGYEQEQFLSHETTGPNHTRLVVAWGNESEISRRAVTVEPVSDVEADVTNVSNSNEIEVEAARGRLLLGRGQSQRVQPPITIIVRSGEIRRRVFVQPAGMPDPTFASATHGDSGLCFTLYVPKTMRPRRRYLALVFMHTEDYSTALMDKSQFDEVAKKRLGPNFEANYQWYTEDIKSNIESMRDLTELTLIPELIGIECDPPQRKIHYSRGATAIAEFRLRTTETTEKELLEQVGVFRDGVRLVEFRTSIHVGVSGPIKIYVSHRLRDVPRQAYRLINELVAHFGDNSVVRDVEASQATVGECDVLLVVIGKQWLEGDLLTDPQHHIRLEIRTALSSGLTVIPVLVDGAAMPSPSELPPDIHDVSFYNAASLRADPHFEPDVERLIKAIEALAPTSAEPVAAKPYRKIYACYAHADSAIVQQIKEMGSSLGLGEQFILDDRVRNSAEATSGDIRRLIDEADIFQLFWSRNAAASSYVRAEVEYALSLNREHFIRPVYWEDPLVIEGLAEALRRLHFQRIRPSVFVAYAHQDREFVEREIAEPLRDHDIRIWSAPEIVAGAQWEQEIFKGLHACEWFLVALSPNSVKSEWARTEVQWAMENRQNRIVPVLIHECDSVGLNLRLPMIQFIDFRNPDSAARRALLKVFGIESREAESRLEPAATTSTLATDKLLGFLQPRQSADEIGRLGDYRVLKLLPAEGSTKVVLQAEHAASRREVVLKILAPDKVNDPTLLQRFRSSAEIQAAVESDYVVGIYEVGEAQGVPYYAMPLLRGMKLRDFLDVGKLLTFPQITRIAREVAMGLAALHEHGIIHRNIKPANIWLDSTQNGRAKIIGFGLAQRIDDDAGLVQRGMAIGTPAYMSPEQTRGAQLDSRSDLFSLGCMVYELCAGNVPFRGKDTVATLSAVTNQEPVPLDSVRNDLPPALINLVHQLLSKDPQQRPASANAVVETIQTIERDWTKSNAPGHVAAPKPQPAKTVTQAPKPAPAKPAGKQVFFAILGLGGAGKTHWQAVLYEYVKQQRQIPPGVRLEAMPSAEGEAFQRYLSALMKSGVSVPIPTEPQGELEFQVQGRSGWFRRGASAEIKLASLSTGIYSSLDDNPNVGLIQSMSGLVYFLDPTHDLAKEDINLISRLQQELRVRRGLDVGRAIKLPLAVCLPKIDQYETRSPLGEAAAAWITALRATAQQPMSLKTLKQRSDLCEQILPGLIPGWNAARFLAESFSAVLFFPISVFGLEHAGQGETDPRKMTMNPFGILEPLLWLLEMNGYRTLV